MKYNLNMQIQFQDLAAKIKTIGLISKKKVYKSVSHYSNALFFDCKTSGLQDARRLACPVSRSPASRVNNMQFNFEQLLILMHTIKWS